MRKAPENLSIPLYFTTSFPENVLSEDLPSHYAHLMYQLVENLRVTWVKMDGVYAVHFTSFLRIG